MRNSTTYKLSGTKTFRLSSSKILGKWGGNLQNVEKALREIYIPDEGKKFVQVDQSGAEALITAYLCRNGNYRQLFLNNVKPHTYLAMQIFRDVWPKKMLEHRLITHDSGFNIDELIAAPINQLKHNPFWKPLSNLIKSSDDWPLTERYYYLGKQAEHSSNYDIQPPMFRMNVLEKSGGKIVISKEDSERFLATKHALFPEIKQDFHAGVRKQVEATKCLYNLHGHPYQITTYDIQETGWKELYAWVPQSTVGEITNNAYCAMQEFIEENGLQWDLLANTHDSYMLQCPIDEEFICAKKAVEFMCQELTSPFDGTKFAMKAEAASGFTWAPAKENKNQNGLREIKFE